MDGRELETRASRMALWQNILGAAVRALALPAEAVPEPRSSRGRGARGCLMPLLIIVVLMVVALAGAAYLFGPALLQELLSN